MVHLLFSLILSLGLYAPINCMDNPNKKHNKKHHKKHSPIYDNHSKRWLHSKCTIAETAHNDECDELVLRSSHGSLISAIENGSQILEQFEGCINRGCSINARVNGQCLLHAAIYCRRKAVVELLLANKADIHALDGRGLQPLHIAVKQRELEMTQLLIDNGADINAQDPQGRTPLSIAAEQGDRPMVALLLEQDAQLNSAHNLDETTFGNDLILAYMMGVKKVANLEQARNYFINRIMPQFSDK